MVSATFIYLIAIVDKIIIVSILLLMLLIAVLIACVTNMNIEDISRKVVYSWCIAFLLAVFSAMLLPTSKTLSVMYVNYLIEKYNLPQTDEQFDKLYKLIDTDFQRLHK